MLYRYSLSGACARTRRDSCRSLNVGVAGAEDMVTNFATNRHPGMDIQHTKIALAVTSIPLSLMHQVARLLGLSAQSLIEASGTLDTPIISNKFLLPNTFFHGKSSLRSRILFASTGKVHRPSSLSSLHYDIRNTYQIHIKT